MACKYSPKSTYSIRLDDNVVLELKARAKAEQTTVGALIRRAIDNALENRAVDEYLTDMEHRIVMTICRSISQLDRHQLQTRRVADIALSQNKYLWFQLIANNVLKRQDGEDNLAAFRRTSNSFMRWLPASLSANGVVRRMIKQVMEPSFIVDEAPSEPARPFAPEVAEPTALNTGEINVSSMDPAKST